MICLSFEAGVQDDQLSLLYEANSKVKVAVKTPNGLTERITMKEIILQGDVLGPIECSVSVDTFGKECLEDDKHLYYYKDKVAVPLLTMVDDAIAVTECGYKACMMNAYLNTKTSIKKLQYGVQKCFKMHVGRTCNSDICPDLYVEGWKMKTVTEVETGISTQEEEYSGTHEMEEVPAEKYLGDILSNDGKNLKNVTARKNRGTGIVTQIMEKLNDICFGKYFFKVAVILRNSHLVSSLLTNAEAWYNVTQANIDLLESVDKSLLRRVLDCPMSTPKEMLYLELGIVPIRYIIKMRRLNFLQYILQEDEDCLIHTFLKAQLEKPTRGDWGQSCSETLEALGINLEIRDIEIMNKSSFRTLVKRKTATEALRYLNQVKSKHSKVLNIVHKRLEIATYFTGNDMRVTECKFLFALRSRMIDVRANYRDKYWDTICPCCCLEEDTQEHLLSCHMIDEEGAITDNLPNYQDLFGNNVVMQMQISRILRKRFQDRKKIRTFE